MPAEMNGGGELERSCGDGVATLARPNSNSNSNSKAASSQSTPASPGDPDAEEILVLETKKGAEPSPQIIQREAEQFDERVFSKINLLRSKLGPTLDKDYALSGLLSHIFRDYEREFPQRLAKLGKYGSLGQPCSITLPPSRVVPLLVEFPPEQSMEELRAEELRDFVIPEPTAFERRTRQEFKVAYAAPAFTQSLHSIGLQLVQERAYADFVSLRHLPDEVAQRGEQAKKVAAQVKPQLEKLRKENAHLHPEWLRCSKSCDFVAPTLPALLHHREFLHRSGVYLQCGFCQERAMTPETLATHYAEEHNVRMLYERPLQKAPCPLCTKDFPLKGELLLHLKDCKRMNKFALLRQFAPGERDQLSLNQWLWEKTKHSKSSNSSDSATTKAAGPMAATARASSSVVAAAPAASFVAAARGVGRPPLRRMPVPMSMPMHTPTPMSPRFANPVLGGAPRQRQSASSSSIHAYAASTITCEICDLALRDRSTLLFHLKSFHKTLQKKRVEDLGGSPPLACSRCSQRFWSYEGLERHLLHSHGLVTTDLIAKAQRKADAGRCKICSKQYAFNLLQHLASDHGQKLCSAEIQYSCDLCPFSSNSYPLLEAHLESSHQSNNNNPAKRPAANGLPPSPALPKAPRLDSRPQKLRYTCTPCNLKFALYNEVIEHWRRKHLKNAQVHLCRVDKCEECKAEIGRGIAVDWSVPEFDPLGIPYANDSGRSVVSALTGQASTTSKPLSTAPPPAPTITLD